MFEFKHKDVSTLSTGTLQRILALVKNAHQFGVDLVSVLQQLSAKAS